MILIAQRLSMPSQESIACAAILGVYEQQKYRCILSNLRIFWQCTANVARVWQQVFPNRRGVETATDKKAIDIRAGGHQRGVRSSGASSVGTALGFASSKPKGKVSSNEGQCGVPR
jgi:hypothetical protein